MINITYQGDLLIAYKVTGDKNVPKGEITFQVNLNPMQPKVVGDFKEQKIEAPLQPISLTEKAAKKWGTTQLPRYKGLGQVAEAGYTNNQWMEGQLIIIGEEYFSFAWVPIEQQIFFKLPLKEARNAFPSLYALSKMNVTLSRNGRFGFPRSVGGNSDVT